jgi:hypothetical protein
VTTKRWSDLSGRTRAMIVIASVFDTILKAAALVDLRHRTADEVRGSRWIWRIAVVLVNAAGAMPVAYFLLGRRKPSTN